MATRTKSNDTAGLKTKKQAASAKKTTDTTKQPVAAKKAGGAEGLLRAGLKALGSVHDDVVKRQTHVIESLLGVRATEQLKARAFAGAGSFGFRKFEDVFDQRVATALERLGMPSAQDIEALRDEVRALREQLARGEGVTGAKR